MAQGVSSLAIKQLTWILVCWDIISPRFEKRRKKEKKVSLRQSLFHQQRRGKQKKTKNVCHLQFISLCCLGTSGLPVTFSQTLNAKLFKIMEENIKQNWHELGFGHVDHKLCSCYTQHKTHHSRKKSKRFHGLYKIKDCYCCENFIQKIKKQHNWEKNICKHISNKGVTSKYTKNSNTTPLKLGKL